MLNHQIGVSIGVKESDNMQHGFEASFKISNWLLSLASSNSWAKLVGSKTSDVISFTT